METTGIYERTVNLIGEEAQKKLFSKKVALIGLGGVGSYVLEALSRAGVGTLIITDFEKIDESNINRQLYALHSTIGIFKTEAARARIADINPDITVITHNVFVTKENIGDIVPPDCDYIIDAIDSVQSKIDIIKYAKMHDILVISCMGTGKKLDNTQFKIADISKSEMCPLAKKIRKQLREEGITKVDVLYSTAANMETQSRKIASISYVPATAGLLIAGYVIQKLIQ
jgi:tRNA A37 threonylcarbamoyladenosine dehydratase